MKDLTKIDKAYLMVGMAVPIFELFSQFCIDEIKPQGILYDRPSNKQIKPKHFIAFEGVRTEERYFRLFRINIARILFF